MKIFLTLCVVALFVREFLLLGRSFRTMKAKETAWHFAWVILLTFMASYLGKIFDLIGG